MQVEIHNSLGHPQVIPCTRVVVKDQYGNPVSVSIEIDDHHIVTTHLDEPGFFEMLRDCGVYKTVLLVNAKQKPIQEIVFPDE